SQRLQRYTLAMEQTLTGLAGEWRLNSGDDEGHEDRVRDVVTEEWATVLAGRLEEVRVLVQEGMGRIKAFCETPVLQPQIVTGTDCDVRPVLAAVERQGLELIRHQAEVMEGIVARLDQGGGWRQRTGRHWLRDWCNH
ncbi:MAG: hypothetical protein HQL66_15670, partial [Magnetococcales bacterium]|nr:hypothetical protein [Magnetococcales bacterium]